MPKASWGGNWPTLCCFSLTARGDEKNQNSLVPSLLSMPNRRLWRAAPTATAVRLNDASHTQRQSEVHADKSFHSNRVQSAAKLTPTEPAK